ncbi:nuclear transport factor 2 family protein (plasmid) [Sinorhizobium meliloti]
MLSQRATLSVCYADPLLVFDVVGQLQREGKALYRRGGRVFSLAWRNREVRAARAFRSRLAFATGLLDCGGTEGGRPVEYTLRLTLGLTRTPDGWRIVQEHSSEPMPFDEKVEG